MKLDEFLKAHEGEVGMAEKLNPEYLATQGVALSDEELDLATGGSMGPNPGYMGKTNGPCRWDSKGRVTHWAEADTGRVYYYGCLRCGRVTHQGTFDFMYCDPCDTYWERRPSRRVYID